MRVGNVLRDDIAWLSLHLLLAADYLDSTAAGRGTWLHNVHVLVVVRFAVHGEFPEVVGEDVGLRAEIELGEHPPHPAEVLPHHVLAANLEGLWEVVDLLVLSSLLEMLWLRLASPHAVPLRAIRSYNSAATGLQRVHHGVVDVGRFSDLEPKGHVVQLEVLLLCNLHFLEGLQLCFG